MNFLLYNIQKVLPRFIRLLSRVRPRNFRKIISLKPDGDPKGLVLLSYVLEPFRMSASEVSNYTHSNYWECVQIANTFLDLGFAVDVINWDNTTFYPKKSYDFVVDIHNNLERLNSSLEKKCIKILHATGAHWLFQNNAEYSRLLSLQKRKNKTLLPRRVVSKSFGIEHANYVSILGNKFTINTFEYAKKPITLIPLSRLDIAIKIQRDFNLCRNNYLWLGSSGMVHKGLDLVLEAFCEMPEYNLTICGPVEKEEDFNSLYYKELYQTKNIHTKGWVNANSPEFEKIVNSCLGLIYPSCSEGQAGSVITCMQTGLVPIISYESGVDVMDFGIILKECTVSEIQKSIRKLSGLSADVLEAKSNKAVTYTKENHSREKFAKAYFEFVNKIIQEN